MGRFIILICAACFLCGCNDAERAQREQSQREQEAVEREKHMAKRDAEIALLSDLSTAIPALEGRIREWISVKDGLILVREPRGGNRSQWHVMPATVPWVVTCQYGAVSVTLGRWVEGDRENVSNTYERDLSHAPLSDEQCKALTLKTGERLRAILKGE